MSPIQSCHFLISACIFGVIGFPGSALSEITPFPRDFSRTIFVKKGALNGPPVPGYAPSAAQEEKEDDPEQQQQQQQQAAAVTLAQAMNEEGFIDDMQRLYQDSIKQRRRLEKKLDKSERAKEQALQAAAEKDALQLQLETTQASVQSKDAQLASVTQAKTTLEERLARMQGELDRFAQENEYVLRKRLL